MHKCSKTGWVDWANVPISPAFQRPANGVWVPPRKKGGW